MRTKVTKTCSRMENVDKNTKREFKFCNLFWLSKATKILLKTYKYGVNAKTYNHISSRSLLKPKTAHYTTTQNEDFPGCSYRGYFGFCVFGNSSGMYWKTFVDFRKEFFLNNGRLCIVFCRNALKLFRVMNVSVTAIEDAHRKNVLHWTLAQWHVILKETWDLPKGAVCVVWNATHVRPLWDLLHAWLMEHVPVLRGKEVHQQPSHQDHLPQDQDLR